MPFLFSFSAASCRWGISSAGLCRCGCGVYGWFLLSQVDKKKSLQQARASAKTCSLWFLWLYWEDLVEQLANRLFMSSCDNSWHIATDAGSGRQRGDQGFSWGPSTTPAAVVFCRHQQRQQKIDPGNGHEPCSYRSKRLSRPRKRLR